jgi:hypothetical protein
MMRLILGLMWTLALFAYLSVEAGRGESPLARSRPITRCWPERGEGLGTDLEQAKEAALRDARDKIVACLRRQKPPLRSWAPDESYIAERLVTKQERGQDLEALDGVTARRWYVYLKAPNWEQFYRLDQEVERKRLGRERMLFLGRVLADVLVLLAGIAVCVRVDERTRGAYRRWLQVAGAGVVAAAWAGLWLLV